MYVSHDHRAVFLALPKNASRSTAAWLKQQYGFEMGPDHHSLDHPEPQAIREYFPFAIVRNPYERMVSRWFGWYQYQSETPTEFGFAKYLAPSFRAYVEGLRPFHTKSDRAETQNHLYLSPQCHVLDRGQELFSRPVWAVPFASLESGLRSLPFASAKVQLPERGVRNIIYGDWRRFYRRNPDLAEVVHGGYRDDFERYGFDKEI